MAYLKLPLKDFASLSPFVSGDKIKVTISGSVAMKMLGGGDDFVTLELGDVQADKEQVMEHPSEYLKRIADLQGRINTPVV